MSLAFAPTATPAEGRRVRVMIVDDAVVVRGLFTRWVEAEPDLELAASLRTGREAVQQLERADPDVVVLDIDMPELDGMAALPQLLAKKPDLIVIMASTLTRRNAEISLRALSLGATDYIPKPDNNREVTTSAAFRRELIEKIRQLGLRAKRFRVQPPHPLQPVHPVHPTAPAPAPAPAARPVVPHPTVHAPGQEITLRPMPIAPPHALLIGASTGGPQALNAVLGHIACVFDRVPVLITQHMPPTFTVIMAEHLTRLLNRPVHEAIDGEPVKAGGIYIAPGGKHMRVANRDGNTVIVLDDGPVINFCKPSVDPLFASAAEIWGSRTLALVLTGMGSDGLQGAKTLVAAGGHVLAQDEATSVVWGMPGQVAHAGLASALLPLNDIAPKLVRLFGGEAP